MKKYNLVICSIFKNEGKYIKEWVEYHRIVGVEHFYLYNNDSTDNYKEELKYYLDKGIVTLIDFPGEKRQTEAYNHFLENYREESVLGAIIDLDEFIVPMHKTTILEEFADIVKKSEEKRAVQQVGGNFVGVSLCWLYYGTSFHIDPPDGLVLENYLNRIKEEDNDNWCKCIYVLDAVKGIMNPHFPLLGPDDYMVDEDGDRILFLGRSFTTKAKHLRVNHYTTRSYKEHLYKLTERGFADGLQISEAHREKLLHQGRFQFNEVFDPLTLRYVPALKNRLKNI
jgi:hypothetical protein